jgi:hypothetical protein
MSGGTFSIRLMDKRNRPLRDREITVFYSGFMSGWEKGYTDGNGWCSFPTHGKSYVTKVYSYSLHGILIQKRSELLGEDVRISDGATLSYSIVDG